LLNVTSVLPEVAVVARETTIRARAIKSERSRRLFERMEGSP
jgi:phosphopantetheine adenylyltransferase